MMLSSSTGKMRPDPKMGKRLVCSAASVSSSFANLEGSEASNFGEISCELVIRQAFNLARVLNEQFLGEDARNDLEVCFRFLSKHDVDRGAAAVPPMAQDVRQDFGLL